MGITFKNWPQIDKITEKEDIKKQKKKIRKKIKKKSIAYKGNV
jgi:hypothetical protein